MYFIYYICIFILQCYLFSHTQAGVLPRGNVLRGETKNHASISIRDAPLKLHQGIFTDTPPIQRRHPNTPLDIQEQLFDNLMNKVVRYQYNDNLRLPSESFTENELNLLEKMVDSLNNEGHRNERGISKPSNLIKKVIEYKLNEELTRPSDIFAKNELRELERIALELEKEEAERKPKIVYEFSELVE